VNASTGLLPGKDKSLGRKQPPPPLFGCFPAGDPRAQVQAFPLGII
jgi:hypothetical protein